MRLSPSALGTFKNCHRCFWLEKNVKVKRPRGIFPSLPSGMDKIIKQSADKMRTEGEIFEEITLANGLADARLYTNQTALNRMRNWRTGLEYVGPEGELSGALDDLLMINDLYAPLDWKTKGSPSNQKDATKYYQTQLDCYSLMLEANEFPTIGFGVLVFFTPKSLDRSTDFCFNVQVIKVDTDIDRAKKLIEEASDCVASNERPDPSGDCEYCSYFSIRNANDKL